MNTLFSSFRHIFSGSSPVLRQFFAGSSLVVMFLTACTSEETGLEKQENMRTVHLSSYMKPATSSFVTRALPTGYEAYRPVYATTDVSESQIHMFMQTDKESILCVGGDLDYDQTSFEWASNFKIFTLVQYYLYGFMPAKASSTATIAPATDYATGATITLPGLTPVLPYDLCAVVGVERRLNLTEDITTSSVDLQPGAFDYLAPYTDVYMYALLDHLYANLDIVMDIDPDYAILRTIKLKSCQINTASGAAVFTAEIPFTANNAGTDPIGTITYTGDGTNAGGGCQIHVPADFTLSTTPQTLHAYICPGAPSSYVMTTVYDVYDRGGKLVRENATVVNRFSIGASTPTRGKSISVNATVSPTYLYQLSNPDFDNPTINLQ